MLENAVIKVVFLTFYNMIQECESVFKSEIYPGLFFDTVGILIGNAVKLFCLIPLYPFL